MPTSKDTQLITIYGRIYLITNSVNGKVYVGQTTETLSRRFNNHKCKIKGRSKIHNAIQKYGKDKFEIQQIDVASSKEELNLKEAFWIIQLNTVHDGYNLLGGGNARKHSEDSKAKMSRSHTGKIVSEEHRKALSKAGLGRPGRDVKGSLHPMFGKRHSQEALAKMSKSHSGKNHYNFGKNLPESTRNKIAAAQSVAVIGTHLKTGEVIRFQSMAEAQRQGFVQGNISLCISEKRNHHRGYKWEVDSVNK